MNQVINPRQKLFQHLDTLAAIKAGKRPPPVNVEIDLSNRCSLGCSWCHFAYTHTRGPLAGKMDKPDGAIDGGDLMDFALYYQMMKQVAAAGVKSITFTGGGEPTLHPRFNDIVRVTNIMTNLEMGMYTHGGHIDEERARLIKHAFTWAFISLDECTPDAYKRSKGVNRFGNVMEGIKRLVAAPGKATIGIGFLLHPGNYTQIYNMQQLGRELGVDYVQFRPTIHFEQDKPNELVEDTAWIDEAVKLLQQYGDDPFIIADISRFEGYAKWNGHPYKMCHWASLQTVITPNGKVWTCTNKREHPDALLGDLSVESFATLWERSGGSCRVSDTCRVMCRGWSANQVLDGIMTPQPHASFP